MPVKKFKLNTQLRSWGRVKGWNATNDLSDTVRDVMRYRPQEKAELFATISAELVKARENLEVVTTQIRSPRAVRGTRFGRSVAARYDRAFFKVKGLEESLAELQK